MRPVKFHLGGWTMRRTLRLAGVILTRLTILAVTFGAVAALTGVARGAGY